VSLEFFSDIIRSHYGPGIDSAANRNEYRVYFLGVKAAGAQGWQPYHNTVPLSWNLGTLTSWNPLGHSRPVTGLPYLHTHFFPFRMVTYCILAAQNILYTLTKIFNNSIAYFNMYIEPCIVIKLSIFTSAHLFTNFRNVTIYPSFVMHLSEDGHKSDQNM